MTAEEARFKGGLKGKLEKLFPGALILESDPDYIQGIPDLLVLWRSKWAALECKADAKARRQTNQKFYVDLMNSMSFAAFIYPENEERVLRDLQFAFGATGPPRLSRRK